jgi:rhomboid family GlyGly-CTERM serine protease
LAKLADWRLPLALTIGSVALQGAGPAATAAMRYDRTQVGAGQLWRLLTGHLVHLGWSHLLLNVAGLVLVWALLGSCYRSSQWLLVLAISALVIDAGFLLLNPELQWYVGMSGVLHGMLAAGVLQAWYAGGQGRQEALVLAVFLIGKLGYEFVAGATPASELLAGGPVVTDAHLYGAVGGVLAAVLLGFANRNPANH